MGPDSVDQSEITQLSYGPTGTKWLPLTVTTITITLPYFLQSLTNLAVIWTKWIPWKASQRPDWRDYAVNNMATTTSRDLGLVDQH